MTVEIRVIDSGRLGNRILIRAQAERIASLVGGDVYQQAFADFGIPRTQRSWASRLRDVGRRPTLRLTGHQIDDEELKAFAKANPSGRIETSAMGFNIDQILPLREKLVSRFRVPNPTDTDAALFKGRVTCHIRGEDVFGSDGVVHPDYPPVPISYLQQVEKMSRRPFAFVGQWADSEQYLQLLRASFPSATFIDRGSALRDFSLLVHAEALALSVSTFAWTAALLRGPKQFTWMPTLGLFNPDQRADISAVLPWSSCVGFPRFEWRGYLSEEWISLKPQR